MSETSDHRPNDDETHDPRLDEPEGDEGMPGELLDTSQNMPGDQREDDRPPSPTTDGYRSD